MSEYGWLITAVLAILMFLGDIIHNKAVFKAGIDRNSDRLNSHSERISKNDDGLNIKVAKKDCATDHEKLDRDNKEWRDRIFGQLERIESGVSDINGRNG